MSRFPLFGRLLPGTTNCPVSVPKRRPLSFFPRPRCRVPCQFSEPRLKIRIIAVVGLISVVWRPRVGKSRFSWKVSDGSLLAGQAERGEEGAMRRDWRSGAIKRGGGTLAACQRDGSGQKRDLLLGAAAGHDWLRLVVG